MINSKIWILSAVMIFLISIISATSSAITLSACGQNLNASGSYLLNQSITSTATCLTTNSSDVEIDCAGFTITYGTAGGNSAFGINAIHSTASQVNLTIKNCIITKLSAAGSSGMGILLTRFANSTILNNTIRTNGTSSNYGINVATGSNGNNISKNIIVTSGTGAANHGIYLGSGSSDSIVEYNNITTGMGTATVDNYGIEATDPGAIIKHNQISTFGSGDGNFGVYSYTSTRTEIINNTLYASGITGNNRGIYLSGSDFAIIANNTINTTGPASPGIYIASCSSINILNNQINSTADSIYMFSATLSDFTTINISRDNTRFGRNITVYGGGGLNLPCPNNTVIDNPTDGGLKFIGCNNVTVQNWYRPNRDTDGLLFVNSDYNKIINNTINGGIEGINMLLSAATCDNNIIANNTISSFGYLQGYAIRIYGSYNLITGNNLSTNGVTSENNAIEILTSYNNITNNLIATGGTSGNLGINLESSASNNLIQNNTITTSGTSGNTGIYFVATCTGNIVRNNTITATGTSGNLGIRLVSGSNNNIIEYNTFYTKGSTSGNNGIDLSSSLNNTFRFNNVYAGYGTGTTDNDAVSLVGSSNNNFTNNVLFANGTATSITSSAMFLQSASTNNTFANNVITKSVGNAIELDFLTTYPSGNTFQNNSLNNVSGSDLLFMDASINDTSFVDQPIGRYNFTGVGGKINVEDSQFGKIAFLSPVNGSGTNMSNDIKVLSNLAQVSSSNGLNKPANVTLRGLSTSFLNPIILKNGVQCTDCYNFTSLNAGNVTFNVTSWSNYSIASSGDNIYPNVTIISPQNTTYSTNSIFLNYTATDNIAVSACWYSIDSSPNMTLAGCSTATISGLIEGSHTLKVYANDTTNNVNYSSVVFGVDSVPPSWSNMINSTPASYSSSALSYFNVTWSGGAQIVLFESNFSGIARNYSMYLISGEIYGFNATLPAGTFYWKSYANDSAGNLNATSAQTFTIAKAGNPVSLYLNGNLNQNLTIDYGTQSNATGIASAGTANLLRDDASVTNPEIKTLSAKVAGYKYTLNSTGNENYTANSTEYYLIVNKATPSVSLLLNGNASDKNIGYGSSSNATAYESNSGDGDLTYNLYKNNVLTASPDVGIFGAGVYIYVYNTTGGENYTSGSASRTLTVNKATSSVRLFLNGNEGNASQTYGSASNITAIDGSSTPVLYRNGIEVSNPDISTLGAGSYNYTATIEETENITGSSVTYFLTLDKANPILSLLINGTDSDASFSTDAEISINASSTTPAGASVELYEDESLIESGVSTSATRNYSTTGNRIWKVNISESENYTSAEKNHTISIIDASYPQYSNLRESPADPATYSSSAVYQFNATWTDNIEISDVILEFNGTNYSLSSETLSQNGNEYYKKFGNLAAGAYSYKWHANDTSNNWVTTPVQTYTISKAVAALFLTITPSNSVSYGTSTSVGCSANNIDSSPSLTRNTSSVSNPDSAILGVGSYNYACTAASTDNYTSASVTGTLVVSKATPTISLTLDGNDADKTANTGSVVNITARLTSPSSGDLNLTENGALINLGASPLENLTTYSSEGTFTITTNYAGNENYTSGSKTHTLTVQTPSSGGSSGGGGGGGGTRRIVNNTANVSVETKTNVTKFEFGVPGIEIEQVSSVVVNPGESKKMSVNIKNSGTGFLNKCKLSGFGDYGSWITSGDMKDLSIGQKAEFLFNLDLPKEIQPGTYKVGFSIICQETTKSSEIDAEIIQKKLAVEMNDAKRLENGNLKINYSLVELSGEIQEVDVQIMLMGSKGVKIAETNEKRIIQANSAETFESILEIPADIEEGNLNLLINANSKTASAFVQEYVLLERGSLSGLSIFDGENSGNIVSAVLVLAFIVFAFIIGRRILRYEGIEKRKSILSTLAGGIMHHKRSFDNRAHYHVE